MKYSIWVIPSEPIYSSLQEIITHLAKKYNSPLFEPHMTLLGEIESERSEIEGKTQELASTASKFELTTGPISFSTTYFQSVFVRVNSSASLMELNLEAKKLFSVDNNVFMPHISLLYGNHTMKEREEIVSGITFEPITFAVSNLVIMTSGLDPKAWQRVATIPFNS